MLMAVRCCSVNSFSIWCPHQFLKDDQDSSVSLFSTVQVDVVTSEMLVEMFLL